jgi:hypothetical protein
MQITTIGLDIAKNVFQVEAGYMTAPVSFRERPDSFPLHGGRRPYTG